jgi:biopolymer transport protein ExbD
MASANIGAGGGSSRRRSLDAEINLVPFIDLLSMCICFLLMTAVWIQLGAVQVKQASGTDAPAQAANTLDLDVKFSSASGLEMVVKKSGKAIQKFKVAGPNEADMLTKLDSELKGMIKKYGQSAIAAVMITPKDGISYGSLVSTMDVLRKNQLVNLGVVPVSPKSGVN